MAPTLFNSATQGPWEPSPWGLSDFTRFPGHPTHLSGVLDAFTTRHHPILGSPTTQKPCQGLPTPGHLPQALGAALGGEGQPEASAPPLPSSSGFIGPPAVGTRACQGRGDNAGSGT